MKVNVEPFQKGKAKKPVHGALRRKVMTDGWHIPDDFSLHLDLVQEQKWGGFDATSRGDRDSAARFRRCVVEHLQDMPGDHQVSRSCVQRHPHNATFGPLEDFDLDRDEAGLRLEFHASECRGVTLFESRTRINNVQSPAAPRSPPDLQAIFRMADQPASRGLAPFLGCDGDGEPFAWVLLYDLLNVLHALTIDETSGIHTPTVTAARPARKAVFVAERCRYRAETTTRIKNEQTRTKGKL